MITDVKNYFFYINKITKTAPFSVYKASEISCLTNLYEMSDKNIVIVQTKYGPVKGDKRLTALGMDYVNFQGIPYMKAPTGKLRFKSPQAPDMWNETFDATQLSPSYPMFNYFAGKLDGIEDGGRINVFTKNVNPAKLYPVMVWASFVRVLKFIHVL